MINNFNRLMTLSATAFGAAIVSIAAPAQAFAPVTFGYGCITGNVAADCATGENQFSTRLSAVTGRTDQVRFDFFNVGLNASSITDIYVEDTMPKTLLSFAQIINSTGVDFSIGAAPPNLPSGQNVGFLASFTADSNSPTQPNGINVGESLGIVFNLRDGYDVHGVLEDLRIGSLRIGLHAQGFDGGGSESFVNGEVPEPMTILGSAMAIAGGAALKRRASSKAAKEKSVAS